MALEDKTGRQLPREEQRNPNPPVPVARRVDNTLDDVTYVAARILFPALGFPAVIFPSGHNPLPNPTSGVQLLMLTARRITPRDVARHLRYVPWSQRRERYSEPSVGANAFAASEIDVAEVTPDRSDKLSQQVRFGDRWVVANLAQRVREFYARHGLPHLFAVTISETASTALKPTAGAPYNLYWISQDRNAKPTDVSPEMKLILDEFAWKRCQDEGMKRSEWETEVVVELADSMLKEYEYEYAMPQSPANRIEVLHPLFVRTPRETIQIAHMTDVHCDTRHQVYAGNLERHKAKGNFNNWNETFYRLYQMAQRNDAILMTGDLIEYGRGHIERLTSLGDDWGYWTDRNWFVYYRLVASGDAGYVAPVYTSLGNHDWRINPYGPKASGAPNSYEFNLRAGDEYTTAMGPDTSPVGKTLLTRIDESAERTALVTDVDSIAWYLLIINPFYDYIAQYPGPLMPPTNTPQRYSFCVLDWGKDEEVMRDGAIWKFQFFSTYEKATDEDAAAGGLILARGSPWAAGAINDLQKELIWWFLTQERTAKVITTHFQIIGPRPSWPQDATLDGLIDPCPICNGWGHKLNNDECPCNQAYKQTPNTRNKHPIIYMGNPGKLSDNELFLVSPRWGSFVQNRDWFLKALVQSDVSAVLSGHNHRNSTFFVRRAYESGGNRAHEAYLRKADIGEAGIAMGIPDQRLEPFSLDGLADKSEQRPIFVNTVCGGPHAKDKVNSGTLRLFHTVEEHRKVNAGRKRGIVRVWPGFRTIEMRPNGDIVSIKKVFDKRLDLIDVPEIDTVIVK